MQHCLSSSKGIECCVVCGWMFVCSKVCLREDVLFCSIKPEIQSTTQVLESKFLSQLWDYFYMHLNLIIAHIATSFFLKRGDDGLKCENNCG